MEADGGEWKRDAAAFVTAEREAIIAARDLSSPKRTTVSFPTPKACKIHPIHHRLVFLSLASIKYITAATRPAFTTTRRRLGALDKDSAVTTAYTNYHHGRHHRPRRHVPAHGH